MNRAMGHTARYWLVDMARGYRAMSGCSGHMAAEAIADQAKGAEPGTLIRFAASYYTQDLSDLQLTRLINEIEQQTAWGFGNA